MEPPDEVVLAVDLPAARVALRLEALQRRVPLEHLVRVVRHLVDVQLRVKDAPPAAIEAEVAAAADYALARPHARLWVNDFWEAAAGRAGCFGCHLGQEDLAALAPADAARLAASGLRLGVSTHCLAELAVAAALAPTYVALGPVFGTTSKRVPFAPRGLDRVAAWRRLVPADTPLVAIGGVGLETAPAVVAAGADAVAVISALGGAEGWLGGAKVRAANSLAGCVQMAAVRGLSVVQKGQEEADQRPLLPLHLARRNIEVVLKWWRCLTTTTTKKFSARTGPWRQPKLEAVGIMSNHSTQFHNQIQAPGLHVQPSSFRRQTPTLDSVSGYRIGNPG